MPVYKQLVEFCAYSLRVAPDKLITATQVTRENLTALSIITKNQNSTVIDDRLLKFELLLSDGRISVQEAEAGDYIIADHAGKYLAVDKEMFEAHYTR